MNNSMSLILYSSGPDDNTDISRPSMTRHMASAHLHHLNTTVRCHHNSIRDSELPHSIAS